MMFAALQTDFLELAAGGERRGNSFCFRQMYAIRCCAYELQTFTNKFAVAHQNSFEIVLDK